MTKGYIKLKLSTLEEPDRLSKLKSTYNRLAARFNTYGHELSEGDMNALLDRLNVVGKSIKEYTD